MTLAELLIRLRVTGTASVAADLGKVKKDIEDTGRSANSALGPLEELGKRLWLLSRFHLGFITAKSALEEATKLDTLKMQLLTVEGQMTAVNDRLKELRQLALQPGVDITNAVKGFASLRTASVSARDAMKDIEAIGNAVARAGEGKEAFDGVMRALLQIKGLPSLMGQEIIQLTQWLPTIRGTIAEALGTANTEELRKMGITGEQAYRRIVDKMREMHKVQPGIQSNIKLITDQFKMTMASMGELLAGMMALATPAIMGILRFFEELPKRINETKGAISGIIGLMTTFSFLMTAPKLINGIATLIDWFKKLRQGVLALGIISGISQALASAGLTAKGAIQGAAMVGAAGLAIGGLTNVATYEGLTAIENWIKGRNQMSMPVKTPMPISGSAGGAGGSAWSMTEKGSNIPPYMIADPGKIRNVWEALMFTTIKAIQGGEDQRRITMSRLGEIAENTRKTWSALDLRQEMLGGGVLARAGVTAAERRSEMSNQLVAQFAGATVTVGGSQLERQIRKVIQDERRRGLKPLARG